MGGNRANGINSGKNNFINPENLKKMAGMRRQDCKGYDLFLFNHINSDKGKFRDMLEPEEIEAYIAKMEENNNKSVSKKIDSSPKNNTAVASGIAQVLYKDIKGAGTDKNFASHLNSIRKDNAADVILQYNNISSKSLTCDILGEIGLSKETRLKHIDKIFNELFAKANELGIDTQQYRVAYKTAYNQVKNLSELEFKNDIFDDALNGLAAAIKGKSELTAQDKTGAVNLTTNETVSNLEEVANEAKEALQNQKDADGWAGKTVDWLSQLWSSQNRAELVDKDIEEFETQIKQLKTCNTEAEFKIKFKEIFGVEYDKELVYAYQQRREQLVEVETQHFIEQSFNNEMKVLLQKPTLKEEVTHVGRTSFDVGDDYVTATKEQVYKREHDKLAKLLYGDNNAGQQLDSLIAQYLPEGVNYEQATDEQKYSAMHAIAKKTSQDLKENVLKVTDNKGYEAFTKECDAMYDAAFGIKNNIARRVEKYNISQQTGAMILKSTVKAGASIGLAMIPGVGLGLAAAGTAAISATVDITDGISSKNGLTNEQITKYLLNAGIDGLTVFAGGQIAKALSTARTAVRVGGQMIGDVATGAAAEYAQTGEITIQGVVFQCVFSATGNIVELKRLASSNIPAGAKKEIIGTTKMTIDGKEVEIDIIRGKDGKPVMDLERFKLPANDPDADLNRFLDMDVISNVEAGAGIPEGIQNTYSRQSIEQMSRYFAKSDLDNDICMEIVDEFTQSILGGAHANEPLKSLLESTVENVLSKHNIDVKVNKKVITSRIQNCIGITQEFSPLTIFLVNNKVPRPKVVEKFNANIKTAQMQKSNVSANPAQTPIADKPKPVDTETPQVVPKDEPSIPAKQKVETSAETQKVNQSGQVDEAGHGENFSDAETIPLTEDEIAYNSIIEELNRRKASNEPITLSELDEIIDNAPNVDRRKLDKIREQVLHDPNVKSYLDDNLNLSIVNNSRYQMLNNEEMEEVAAIYNEILTAARQEKINSPEDLSAILNDNHKYNPNRASSMSQDEIDAISDILRNDPIMQQNLGADLVDIVLNKYFF